MGGTFCPPDRRRYVLVAAILASAMGFIDGSVVSIAIPAMRTNLGATLSDAQWISNGYMLFMASLILIGGAAGDRFGLRRVFGFGIVVFVVASLLCAVAPTPLFLIICRAIQGFGAAFMVPGSLALIAKAYPRDQRGKAIGIWATAASLTTILGPVVGGALLSALGPWSWRLVFAINLPFGLAALALLWLRVPPDPAGQGGRLDWFGGLLITVSLFLLALGLTGEGGAQSVPTLSHILVYCGIGIILLLVFLVWESRTPEPMLPLRLFGNRAFSGANALTFALYFSLAAISFYLPMTLIAGWGLKEAEVSLSFVPVGVCLTLLSPISGGMADRYGTAKLIAGGASLVALAFAGLAITAPLQNFWFAVVPLMTLMGIGMGFVVTPLSTAVMTSVADSDTGTASGVNNAVARVAALFAVAIMGGVAALVFGQIVAGAGLTLSFGQPVDDGLTAQQEGLRVTATNAAFSAIAWGTAVLSAISAVIAWLTLEHKDKAAAK
ncbi:MAG TPA: MFS transporter [Devosiaceae bacterium]|nr:MFS transporter [Devosiaceae bacterium]